MAVATCNACNLTFNSEKFRGLHYRSDWHRYNLKRKVAGLPGVTEQWFEKRRQALVGEEPSKGRMVYRCQLCGKEYSSAQAHANHLQSRTHVARAAADPMGAASAPLVRPAPPRGDGREDEGDVEEEEDVEEGDGEGEEEEELLEADWEVERCIFCDERFPEGEIAACVEHMHRQHGFFLPEAERLRDPRGVLQYLGLKVSLGHLCLYCDERSRQYGSGAAVRRHMADRAHCKLRWGDGSGAAEAELEEFYDFSNGAAQEAAMQVALQEGTASGGVDLVTGGEELRVKGEACGDARVLGSRDLARYYRQKPRPSESRDSVLANAVVAKYRSLGLSTRQGTAGRTRRQSAARAAATAAQEQFRGLQSNVLKNVSGNSSNWGR